MPGKGKRKCTNEDGEQLWKKRRTVTVLADEQVYLCI